jgi:hypothetical protein
MKSAVCAIFPMDTQLEQVVASLNAAGFDNSTICVFLSREHSLAAPIRKLRAVSEDFAEPARSEHKACWLSSFGGVVIPGIAFYAGSREYLRSLTGWDISIEDESGEALVNLGMPADTAARYNDRVNRSGSLVFISCEDAAQSEWAREILRLLRAEEVCLLGEAGDGESIVAEPLGAN